jgi:antitoxin component YwqK of YwqJK toxin-antitoxin module
MIPGGEPGFDDPNGQLSSSGPAIRGLRTGAWTEWHDDGSRAAQGEYHEGLRQGPWSFFARDGSLIEQGSFERGVKRGEWWRARPSAKTPQ